MSPNPTFSSSSSYHIDFWVSFVFNPKLSLPTSNQFATLFFLWVSLTMAVGDVMRMEIPAGGDLTVTSPELHVLAVDDSIVDRKVIERLLRISSCKGKKFSHSALFLCVITLLCFLLMSVSCFCYLSDDCRKWDYGFAVSWLRWRHRSF